MLRRMLSMFSICLQSIILTGVLTSIPTFVHTSTLESDTEALRSLKQYIDPNSISASSYLDSWDFKLDPCESSGDHFLGILCTIPSDNSSSRVTEIELDGFGYDGFLPQQMGNLTELTVLNLSKNKLRGPIPETISGLKNLTRLEVSENFFTGSIPAGITGLRKLRVIDMSHNRLSGTISAKISGLRRLNHLSLSGNAITGRIPDLAALWQLDTLDLSNNQFYGNLPKLPKSLRRLSVSHNILSGEISSSITTLQNLRLLDLSDNRFSGAIRWEILALPEIIHTNVSVNRFRTLEMAVFPDTQLQVLDAHSNNLVGHLPVNLVSMENLVDLNLAHNQFSGEIPVEYWSKQKGWRNLFLQYNFLTGNVPQQLAGNGTVKNRSNLSNNCLKCPKNVIMCHGGQRPAAQCAGTH